MLRSNDERCIYLFDEIDNMSVKEVIEKINSINILDNINDKKKRKYKRKPIQIFINSYGGSVYSALGLYSIIKKSKTKVYTYAIGSVMSAAFTIFLAGHKRFSYKYSRFMYHELSYSIEGKLKDMKVDVIDSESLQKDVDDIIISETLIKQQKLNKVRNKKSDWVINTDEAIKLKVIKKVV